MDPEIIWAFAGAIAFLASVFQELRHRYNHGTHMPRRKR